MKKLNLGCGDIRKEGYINIDIIETKATDVVADVSKKIPLPDNSVDEIYSRMFLEHTKDFDKAIEEIYRVSKNGAQLVIIVPFCFSYCAFHPDHHNFFNHMSFNIYFSNDNRWTKGAHIKLKKEKIYFHFQPFGKLNPLNFFNWMFSKIANKKPDTYMRLFAHLFPAYSIYYKLEVIKD